MPELSYISYFIQIYCFKILIYTKSSVKYGIIILLSPKMIITIKS